MGIKLKNKDLILKRLNDCQELDYKDGMVEAVKLVQAQAKALAPVMDGTLRESIHMDVKKEKQSVIGQVYTNCEYAPYVEFGTGTVGNGSYQYSNELEEGLTYSSRKYWRYQDKNGNWHTTKGQKAQPYMYPALKMNEQKVVKLIGKNIEAILKGDR